MTVDINAEIVGGEEYARASEIFDPKNAAETICCRVGRGTRDWNMKCDLMINRSTQIKLQKDKREIRREYESETKTMFEFVSKDR